MSFVTLPIDPVVRARVDRVELPWNRLGLDPYGVSKVHLAEMFTAIGGSSSWW